METGTVGAPRSDRFGIDDSAARQADTSPGEAPTLLPDTPYFRSSVVTGARDDGAAAACTDVANIWSGREGHRLLECHAWPHRRKVGVRPRLHDGGRRLFGGQRLLPPARRSRDIRLRGPGLLERQIAVCVKGICPKCRSRRGSGVSELAPTPDRGSRRRRRDYFATRRRDTTVVPSTLGISTRSATQQHRSQKQGGFLVISHGRG